MFPGVKTPGYSQDVPPGQRNLAAAFSARKATRYTSDAFMGFRAHGVCDKDAKPDFRNRLELVEAAKTPGALPTRDVLERLATRAD